MSSADTAGLDPTFGKAVDAWLSWLRAEGGAPQVYVLSGLRTADEQMALRRQNCPDPLNSPSGDCDPPTARVGESQHQRGLAVDIAPASAYAAAGGAAGRFRLRATVSGEPWHFELADGTGAQGVLGGLGDAAGAVLDALVPNVVPDAVSGALGGLSHLVDPRWWLRVGVGAAGVLLGLVGVLALADQSARGLVAEALG